MANIKCSGQIEAATKLKLGRRDGTANTPYIDFHTDGSSSTEYNTRIAASGNSLNVAASGGLKVNNTSLLDLTYPVGSVYISTNSTSPASLFGGTWSQISQGRALYGEGSCSGITYSLGSSVSAGLPNIYAYMKNWRSFMGESYDEVETSGAFSHALTSGGGHNNLSWGGVNRYSELWFEAKKSNSIYGNSSTVQPNAYVVKIWKRVS